MQNGSGFSIKSWRDVLTIGMILAIAMSALIWFLKIDGQALENSKEIAHIEGEVAAGILPRAEERINSLSDRVRKLELAERGHQ